MGSDEDWEMATSALQQALEELGQPTSLTKATAPSTAPKLTSIWKTHWDAPWQCGTIQLDFQMPQRFELEYTGADGEKHRPIMIHRRGPLAPLSGLSAF